MHKLFRSTRILYWTVCAAIFVLFLSQTLLAMPLLYTEVDGAWVATLRIVQPLHDFGSFNANLAFWGACTIVGIFLAAFGADLWATKKYRRILDVLYDDCDPDRFLAAAAPLLARPEASASARLMLRNDFAVGLIARGDADKAWGILENLSTTVKGKRGALPPASSRTIAPMRDSP